MSAWGLMVVVSGFCLENNGKNKVTKKKLSKGNDIDMNIHMECEIQQ